MKAYMYILLCADGSYYVGSTTDLDERILAHQLLQGSNYTRKHLPLKLVYSEEYHRSEDAFHREKQVQRWSRKKKEALINRQFNKLCELSRNYTQFPR